jgi:hypothetical protein
MPGKAMLLMSHGAKDDIESMKEQIVNISICVLQTQETNVKINDLYNSRNAHTSI